MLVVEIAWKTSIKDRKEDGRKDKIKMYVEVVIGCEDERWLELA
jgi:hypothetical protein